MKRKSFLLLFSIILTLSLASFVQVSACSCVSFTHCQDFQRAEVVFIGKLVEIKKLAENAFVVTLDDDTQEFKIVLPISLKK